MELPPLSPSISGAQVALALAVVLTLSSQAAAQASTSVLPTDQQQIGAAVLPLPKELRAGATVIHVACYHRGLEPFMARGRELRTQGLKGAQVDSVRFAEVKSGKLKMPTYAALYSLTGTKSSWDPASGTVTGASPLGVVYMPFATGEGTGLSVVPVAKGPWMMFPGTPKAHVMIVGSMDP